MPGKGLARFRQIVDHAAVLRFAASRSIQNPTEPGNGGAVCRKPTEPAGVGKASGRCGPAPHAGEP